LPIEYLSVHVPVTPATILTAVGKDTSDAFAALIAKLAEERRAHQSDLNLPEEIDTIEPRQLNETQKRDWQRHSEAMYERLVNLRLPFKYIKFEFLDPQGSSAQCMLCWELISWGGSGSGECLPRCCKDCRAKSKSSKHPICQGGHHGPATNVNIKCRQCSQTFEFTKAEAQKLEWGVTRSQATAYSAAFADDLHRMKQTPPQANDRRGEARNFCL